MMKRFLCVLMAAIVAAGFCVMPAAAEDMNQFVLPKKYFSIKMDYNWYGFYKDMSKNQSEMNRSNQNEETIKKFVSDTPHSDLSFYRDRGEYQAVITISQDKETKAIWSLRNTSDSELKNLSKSLNYNKVKNRTYLASYWYKVGKIPYFCTFYMQKEADGFAQYGKAITFENGMAYSFEMIYLGTDNIDQDYLKSMLNQSTIKLKTTAKSSGKRVSSKKKTLHKTKTVKTVQKSLKMGAGKSAK